MADLNTNVHEAFNDRVLLDRTVRSIQLARDIGYLDAFEALRSGAESASAEGHPTLHRALDYAADADYCEHAIKLLRRDAAVAAAEKAAVKQLPETDAHGRVPLSASKAAKILSDHPTATQKRLMRARALDRTCSRASRAPPSSAAWIANTRKRAWTGWRRLSGRTSKPPPRRASAR
jgi:hypothetical protein